MDSGRHGARGYRPTRSWLNLAAEFGHADTGDVPGQPPVAHPGDA
jgi:hypothetical protein